MVGSMTMCFCFKRPMKRATDADSRSSEALASAAAKAAEEKIALAEAQALAELRALAADTAVTAAEKLIAARLDDKRAADLIKRSLEEIPSKLN